MIISSHRFSFFRIDGTCIADDVHLREDSRIVGINSENEFRWEEYGDKLLFFSETGELASIFNYRIESSGRLIFLGKFLYADMEIFHILVENIPSIEDSLNRISGNGEHINHVLLRVEETLNAATRQIKLPHGVKKIVFLIHNMATWDSISEVCEKIKENNKF